MLSIIGCKQALGLREWGGGGGGDGIERELAAMSHEFEFLPQ